LYTSIGDRVGRRLTPDDCSVRGTGSGTRGGWRDPTPAKRLRDAVDRGINWESAWKSARIPRSGICCPWCRIGSDSQSRNLRFCRARQAEATYDLRPRPRQGELAKWFGDAGIELLTPKAATVSVGHSSHADPVSNKTGFRQQRGFLVRQGAVKRQEACLLRPGFLSPAFVCRCRA